MQTVDKVIDQIDALPSAPQILPKLLSALAETDTDISHIVDLIAYDPGLTAKVLQLCNSAWLAGAAPVSDIGDAINRLGLRCIYRLVAALNGSRALRPARPVRGLEANALWRHSVITALAAQFMAQDQGQDESIVFTSALLHDAGKIVLAQAYKTEYETLLLTSPTPPGKLADRERQCFGIDHAETGGRILARWQFPEPMVTAVTFHHAPEAGGEPESLAAYVCVADALAHFLDDPSLHPDNSGTAAVRAMSILGFSATAFERYRHRTLENFEFVNALCRL